MPRRLPIFVAALLLVILTIGEASGEATGEEELGYTLDDWWNQSWLQIFDRRGRPDPDGPMLQRFDGTLYRRYHFDMHVPHPPMATEQKWFDQRHGVRMWVQSMSELELASRVQMRIEAPSWEGGYIGLRFDRLEDRITGRNHLRFDVGHRDIADTGVDVTLRFHPGFDKDDIDVELISKYSLDGVGDLEARIGALDPFINASFGLLEARDVVLDEHIRQVDLPLALSANFRSETIAQFRGELYAGVVLPQNRRHRFADDPTRDHLRRRQALLGAAVLEWSPHDLVTLGTTATVIDAQMDWEFDEASDRDGDVRERTISTRLYAMNRPIPELYLESFIEHTRRPQWERGPRFNQNQTRRDAEWLLSLRSMWMVTDTFGADLTFLLLNRDTDGPPELTVDGRFTRIVTRLKIRLGEDIWTTFGVGWSFDPETHIYDGGGMTLVYTPSR